MSFLTVAWILASLAGWFSAAEAGLEQQPVRKIDRARVIGPPVIDRTTPPGIYFWLEDGWYQIAAITDIPFQTKSHKTRIYRVRVAHAQPIIEKLGHYHKSSGESASNHVRRNKAHKDGGVLELEVRVGATPEQAAIKTEGEVTILEATTDQFRALPIFVGPASKPAAPGVKIGRY